MEESMETQATYCRRCGVEIPAARLQAIPETLVCVKCSEEIGGEFELKITMSGMAKPGSLKVTGQHVAVKLQRKPLR
jgi:DksA/TraR C4-type zinc finger protein